MTRLVTPKTSAFDWAKIGLLREGVKAREFGSLADKSI
jgi:hypothetical protein